MENGDGRIPGTGPTSPNPSHCFSKKPHLKGIKQTERDSFCFCSYVKTHKLHKQAKCHTQVDHMHTNTQINILWSYFWQLLAWFLELQLVYLVETHLFVCNDIFLDLSYNLFTCQFYMKFSKCKIYLSSDFIIS